MNKKLVKFACLAASCVGMISLSSCKKDEKIEVVDLKHKNLNTTHIRNVSDTNSYILNNENCDYVILLSNESSENESKAASIFSRFFIEATGKSLVIKKDNETFAQNFISFGKTSNALNNNFKYEEKNISGFKIKTIGSNIYVDGGSDGIIYGSYELLKYFFNFDYFQEYDYVIDKNVKSIKLLNFDVYELPDFYYRASMNSPEARSGSDPMYRQCLRVNDLDFPVGGVGGNTMHNTMGRGVGYVPWYETDAEAQDKLGEYYKPHYRDWYANTPDTYDASIPSNLCYTRYVDEYYPLALHNLILTAEQYPNTNCFEISNMDNLGWCECESCKALPVKSMGYVKFLNRLAKDIKEWGNKHGREISLDGLAYYGAVDAPVKEVKDSSGKVIGLEPIDNDCLLEDNIRMLYAPHTSDYQLSFDEKGNETDMKNIKGWSLLCADNKFDVYLYDLFDYSNYFMFYDVFSSMQQNYQILNMYHASWIHQQGQYNTGGATAFNNLKAYLQYKLMWDCQLEINPLIDKFFNHVFGEASEPMRNIFEALMNRFRELHDDGIVDQFFYNYTSKKIFPKGFVKTLSNYIDEAYEKIENSSEKQRISTNIRREAVFIHYLQIEIYGSDYLPEELLIMKNEFKNDCKFFNMTRSGEGVLIETFLARWGI